MSNKEKLKEILALILKIDVNEINESTSYNVIESWDSLNHMNIILSIEEEFNIKISDEVALDLTSYPLLLKFLKLWGIFSFYKMPKSVFMSINV